jgi:hypothetical protein
MEHLSLFKGSWESAFLRTKCLSLKKWRLLWAASEEEENEVLVLGAEEEVDLVAGLKDEEGLLALEEGGLEVLEEEALVVLGLVVEVEDLYAALKLEEELADTRLNTAERKAARKEKVLLQCRGTAEEKEATIQREAAKEEELMRIVMAQGHQEGDGENQGTSLRLERCIESDKTHSFFLSERVVFF